MTKVEVANKERFSDLNALGLLHTCECSSAQCDSDVVKGLLGACVISQSPVVI